MLLFKMYDLKMNIMKSLITTILITVAFGLYAQNNLTPPTNLQATVNGNDIELNWSPPDTSSFFLSWDNGITGNIIGLTGEGTYSVAARWDSATLTTYENYSISKLAFFIPSEATAYTAYIWQGPNADSVIFSEPINQVSTSDWTYVNLTTPINFDVLQDLWIGYEVVQPAETFPAGTDFGPAIPGNGDMINLDGTWVSMSQFFGLDFNFNIRMFLTSGNNQSLVMGIDKKPAYYNYSNDIILSSLISDIVLNPSSAKEVSNLIGFNVYKNGELITPVTLSDTMLLDPSLDLGIYNYEVTAVYVEGESTPASVTTQIGNPEMIIFPEEITDTLIVGNFYEYIITIYNEGNVDLLWSSSNSAYWSFISPPSGIIEPNNGIDIQLFINTFNLTAGDYTTDIIFTQNNQNNPTDTLTVNINAIGSPGIAVFPQALSFGDVVYGDTYTTNLNIQNIGTETLLISDIAISNENYTIGNFQDSIAPFESVSILVSFEAINLGESSGTLTIFSNDEINPEIDVPLSAYVYLQPPVLLQSEVTGNDVTLNWEMAIAGEGEWIHWDNGENFTGIGLTGGGTFQYAARWDTFQLGAYEGKIVPKIAFFPFGANSSYTLKIWKGENASIPLVSQEIENFTANQWNEVFVQNPFSIDATNDLWVGIEVSHPEGDFPAGADSGPAVFGYGDMINLSGTWESAASLYGLDLNWNLQFFVLSGDTAFKVVSSPEISKPTTKFYNIGEPIVSDEIANKNTLFTPKKFYSDLLGYNVYRDDNKLNDNLLEESTYTDLNVPYGNYMYGVTAVYDIGESPQIQKTIQVGAPNIIFNPEMISDSLESGELAEHIITISNDGNFDLDWFADIQASWMSISETSGSIAPGNSIEMIVTLNSSGLFNGNYLSNIVFEVNNLNNPVIYYPVQINVSGEAQLVLTPDTLDFGVTALGTTKTAYITISNIGNDFIFIADMQTSPDVFSSQSFPVYLYPGGVISLGIYFTPDSLGTFTGTFTVNAGDSATVTLQSVLIGSSLLPPPTNLTAEVDSNNVFLDWQNPFGGSENVIQYSDDQSSTGLGYTDGGAFLVAAKFGPEELMIYGGKTLNQLGFIPWSENAEFNLKVWIGENAEDLVLSQPVSDFVPFEWNDIPLEYSIPIDTSDFLWIGYEVIHEPGDFPAGCDFGPANPGKGDLISTDGISWESLTFYGLSYNWNVRGTIDTGEKSSNLLTLPIIEQKNHLKGGIIKSVISPKPNSYKFAPSNLNLLGYNVFRNGAILNNNQLITTSEFLDTNLENGQYFYEVTAVYDIGESYAAGPIEVVIEDPALIPSGWNQIQTGMTHIIHIPTAMYGGNSNFMSPGDWIGVFYEDNGEYLCGGNLIWTESDSLKMIVYGDDPTTPQKDGFEIGEWMHWKVYMSQSQEEFNINVIYNTMMPQYNGLFYMLGQSAITEMDLTFTGVKDNETSIVTIYPNPSSGAINILGIENFEQIQLFDMVGRMVFQESLEGNTAQSFDIDLPNGLYYITLSYLNNTITKKIVIRN